MKLDGKGQINNCAYQRNVQFLMTDFFVKMKIKKPFFSFKNQNCYIYGSESIRSRGPLVWATVPHSSKIPQLLLSSKTKSNLGLDKNAAISSVVRCMQGKNSAKFKLLWLNQFRFRLGFIANFVSIVNHQLFVSFQLNPLQFNYYY